MTGCHQYLIPRYGFLGPCFPGPTHPKKDNKTLPLLLIKEMIKGRGSRREKKKKKKFKGINLFVRMSPILSTEVKLFMAFVVLTFISKLNLNITIKV